MFSPWKSSGMTSGVSLSSSTSDFVSGKGKKREKRILHKPGINQIMGLGTSGGALGCSWNVTRAPSRPEIIRDTSRTTFLVVFAGKTGKINSSELGKLSGRSKAPSEAVSLPFQAGFSWLSAFPGFRGFWGKGRFGVGCFVFFGNNHSVKAAPAPSCAGSLLFFFGICWGGFVALDAHNPTKTWEFFLREAKLGNKATSVSQSNTNPLFLISIN